MLDQVVDNKLDRHARYKQHYKETIELTELLLLLLL